MFIEYINIRADDFLWFIRNLSAEELKTFLNIKNITSEENKTLFQNIIFNLIQKTDGYNLNIDKFSYYKAVIEMNNCLSGPKYKKLEKYFFDKYDELVPMKGNENVLSFEFISNIGYLRGISKNIRRSDETYQKMLNIFLNHFYNLGIEKKYEKILELLFNRIINVGGLVNVLKLNHINQLYFYFKTNIVDQSVTAISLEELEKIKCKTITKYCQYI